MRSVENALKSDKNNILTVWFNAWRYEREEQFALVSLMKAIAYKMDEQPEKYERAKQVFYKSIITALKGLGAKLSKEVATTTRRPSALANTRVPPVRRWLFYHFWMTILKKMRQEPHRS